MFNHLKTLWYFVEKNLDSKNCKEMAKYKKYNVRTCPLDGRIRIQVFVKEFCIVNKTFFFA